ncbi:MAG: PCRF domain-containing protein, partial [Acutalibacteraceae bacterium]|nr:PCRF domain-containing protein [Acutalibacteraceae bacterium]
MFDKLKEVEKRYDDIQNMIADPAVIADMGKYTELMRESKRLLPIVEKFREYESVKTALNDAKEMLGESGLDKDFRD